MEQNQHRWAHMHLSTCIILMIVAGVLVYINFCFISPFSTEDRSSSVGYTAERISANPIVFLSVLVALPLSCVWCILYKKVIDQRMQLGKLDGPFPNFHGITYVFIIVACIPSFWFLIELWSGSGDSFFTVLTLFIWALVSAYFIVLGGAIVEACARWINARKIESRQSQQITKPEPKFDSNSN